MNLVDQILNDTTNPLQSKGNGAGKTPDKDRAILQAAIAAKQGIAMPDPIYAIGTPVVPMGVDSARQKRQDFEALPYAEHALQEFHSYVAAEKRSHITVNAHDLIMGENGLIRRKDQNVDGIEITAKALSHLFATVSPAPAHAGSYLSSIPADRRAVEFNHALQAAENRKIKVMIRKPKDQPWQGYNVATERYTAFYPTALATALLDGLQYAPSMKGARAEIKYTGERTAIRLIAHSNVKAENYVAGEIFQAALTFKIADDKTGGIASDFGLLRNLCLNLIILGKGTAQVIRLRHTGSAQDIGDQIERALADTGARFMEPWLKLWSERRAVEVAQPYDVLNWLAGRRADQAAERKASPIVQAVGASRELVADRLRAAFDSEPEATWAGITNAVTRAAHENPWASPWAQEDMAQQGGAVLELYKPSLIDQIVADMAPAN